MKIKLIPGVKTVLEGPTAIPHDDDADAWGGYMTAGDDGAASRRWGHSKSRWCRPSCIPISIICVLIFLVVLLPLLDHATERALHELNRARPRCANTCRLGLVETVPEGMRYPDGTADHPSTYDTWSRMIRSAERSIDIASLYWTMRRSEVYPDPSSRLGEEVFQLLMRAGTERGVRVRVAQNAPTQEYPNTDTELLVKRKAAAVRSLNFNRLMGGGVLHTKMWVIDGRHVYLGSANMDWRSLTQVKEMGVAIYNCTCLAEDAAKVFDAYWMLGEEDAQIPTHWPDYLATEFNLQTPYNLSLDNETFHSFISSSPAPLNAAGRTDDIDALVNVIRTAERFVYVAVMDYFPQMIYTPKKIYWPVIDDALRSAAIDRHVTVKMLISRWNHSRPSEDFFLRSLQQISGAYPLVDIQIRRFVVPADDDQRRIPFARVNHNKYMVTDSTAYIGTSNWSGDYFTDTAGVALVMHDPVFERNATHVTLRSQLQAVFERDWNSPYATGLDEAVAAAT